MAEGYSLSKFGKVYILRHGCKMETVPLKMYMNGNLELHEQVLTTAEGDAYQIGERNGQITFEAIPMASISETDTKDPPVLSQPSAAMPKRRNADHLSAEDNDNKDRTKRTRAICHVKENIAVNDADFHPDATKQQDSIAVGPQSNPQRAVVTEGKDDTVEQAVGHKRGKVKIFVVTESSPDGEEIISNNDKIPQRGMGMLQVNIPPKASTVEIQTIKNDEVDGHRVVTYRHKGRSSSAELQENCDDGHQRGTGEQTSGGVVQKNCDDGHQRGTGEQTSGGVVQKRCVSGQMPIDHICSDECVEESESPYSIKIELGGASADYQNMNRAAEKIVPRFPNNQQLQQCTDDRHGTGDSSRQVNANAPTIHIIDLDFSQQLSIYSIEMDEQEYMAMPYLFNTSMEMAEKIAHMSYDENKGCMVFSVERDLLEKVVQKTYTIRQEKREVILTEMDDCLRADNCCMSVQKSNQRVICQFIPVRDKIVIYGPDRKNVADAEYEIGVHLRRKPFANSGREERKPSPGTGSSSSHPLSGMRYPPDMKEYQGGGLTVNVYTGDIRQLPVECIIVSDLPSLRGSSGVAQVVRQAAGKGYKDECKRKAKANKGMKEGQCVMTSAGALSNYKGIVHVYLPTNNILKETRRLDTFGHSIVNCLEMADGMGFTSVAIPCIGTGLLRFTIEKCAQQYFSALDRFSKSAIAVSDIHFVDDNPNKIKQVNNVFEKNFRQERYHSGSKPYSFHTESEEWVVVTHADATAADVGAIEDPRL